MVPEHWGIERLKHSVESLKNGVWGSEPQMDNKDMPCVRIADFDRNALRVILEEQIIRNVPHLESCGHALSRRDLVLDKSGGGEEQPVSCVVLFDDSSPAVCLSFLARMSVASGMSSSYWRYVHAVAYTARVNPKPIKQTSGIQNLDSAQYLDELTAFPPLPEQHTIAERLDADTARIEGIIADAEKTIALLRESHTAVISDAVTAKIDVRERHKEDA